jgi:hypothetical protein
MLRSTDELPLRPPTHGRRFDRRFVLTIQRLERTDVVEILERIFDKGIVVDAWARISLAGIHLATIEARIVMASLETHLEYATELNDVVAPSRSALDGSQSLSARERASLRIVHKAFDAWNFRDVDGYTALLDNGYIGETHRNPTPLRGPEDGRQPLGTRAGLPELGERPGVSEIRGEGGDNNVRLDRHELDADQREAHPRVDHDSLVEHAVQHVE